MARPTKQGLDYYSKDVKAKYDTKFKYVESKNTVIARLVIYELWDLIYGEEGYYTRFDKIQRVLFLGDLPIDDHQLTDILDSCFEIKMFDKELYEKFEILTSVSIQKRYLEAVGRRAKVLMISDYFLLDEKSYRNIFLVNVDNNPINVGNNSINDDINKQSKEKKSKEKKRKVNKSSKGDDENILKKIFQFYESNGFGTLASKTMQDFEYWIDDFVKIGATENDAADLIIYVMGFAVDYNKRSYGYVNRVLQDWERKRYLTVADAKAAQIKSNKDKEAQQKSSTDYDELDWG